MEKKCVLIYDDDIETLNVCRAILGSYRVEALTTCENIIADIEELKPELILMDLWIPKIGGENAINLMHENEKTKHIPVIVFSANNNIREISERVKANAVLEKPFNIKCFRKMIEKNIL